MKRVILHVVRILHSMAINSMKRSNLRVDYQFSAKKYCLCNISQATIAEFRDFYPDHPKGRKHREFTNFNETPTDEQLVDWASEWLRPHLQPCIDQVIELDQNDELYNAMIAEPLVLDPEDMKGAKMKKGVMAAYDFLANTNVPSS